MTKDEFILWLHGFFEISNPKTLNEEQTALIKGEVERFFNKVTPERYPITPTEEFDKYWEEISKYKPTPVIPAPNESWPNYKPLKDPIPHWEAPKITCDSERRLCQIYDKRTIFRLDFRLL